MSFQMVLLLMFWFSDNPDAFWNYVIPDGSTTFRVVRNRKVSFWNYVIPDGSTTPLEVAQNVG